MIIIDENVEHYWIQLLKDKGYELISIAEEFPGISDREIIKLVKNEEALLITEDKDFGELIFAYGYQKIAIIFLRYDQPVYNQIEKALISCIKEYFDNPAYKFITITKNKIRTREL